MQRTMFFKADFELFIISKFGYQIFSISTYFLIPYFFNPAELNHKEFVKDEKGRFSKIIFLLYI